MINYLLEYLHSLTKHLINTFVEMWPELHVFSVVMIEVMGRDE